MDYILHIFVLIGIYTVLSKSLDLAAGQAGLLSLAHASFYGLGAYTSALLTTHLGAPFFLGLVFGMFLASSISLVISLPSLRLYGDYFVIATFGAQMIIHSIFNNWFALTRGPLGISAVPQPVVLGWAIQSRIGFVSLAFLLAMFTWFIVERLSNSAYGRVLHAIREDEVFAQSLGKNTLRFKVNVFAVSAALAASAGSLYAHYTTYIDPSLFTVMESVLVLSMVILGGAGSTWGPVLGSAVLVVLPEALRFVGLPIAVAANLRQLLYGILLVLMMMFRPRGLVGRYSFEP